MSTILPTWGYGFPQGPYKVCFGSLIELSLGAGACGGIWEGRQQKKCGWAFQPYQERGCPPTPH